MSDKKISSFEKIGYIRNLPQDADVNNYEKISVKDRSGNKTILYRILKINKIDNTKDFNSSWNTYNKLIMILFLSLLQHII